MSIKHILVSSDFSATAAQALANALSIARSQNAKITLLHIVTIYNDDPYNEQLPFPDIDAYYEKLEEKAGRFFQNTLSVHAHQDVTIDFVVRRGFSPYEEILSFAADNDVDLISMGTHSRKPIARFFLGSVALNVVHNATCPVLTVRIEDSEIALPIFRRILVATDFYEQSERALKFALSLLQDNSVIDLLHVVEDVIYPAYFAADGDSIFDVMPHIKVKSEDVLKKIALSNMPSTVNKNLIIKEGKIATTILQYAKEINADIIVMGTHSMSAMTQFLIGSQANKIIRKATCPVITIK